MIDYEKLGVSSAEDVDRITAREINKIHGSPADELKNLRRGMLVFYSMIRPGSFQPKERENLLSFGERLMILNAQTENIINEGREFKKSKGWV